MQAAGINMWPSRAAAEQNAAEQSPNTENSSTCPLLTPTPVSVHCRLHCSSVLQHIATDQCKCKWGGLARINSRILQRRIVVFYVSQQNGNNILLRMIGQIYEWMQVRRGWPQAPLTGVNRTMGTRGG